MLSPPLPPASLLHLPANIALERKTSRIHHTSNFFLRVEGISFSPPPIMKSEYAPVMIFGVPSASPPPHPHTGRAKDNFDVE